MHAVLLSHFLVCTLLAAISIPLILRKVPPNRWYGIRLASTLADTEVWYRVNRLGGWLILIAALSSAAGLAAAQALMEAPAEIAGLIVVLPLAIAVIILSRYTKRITNSDSQQE